MSVFIFTLAPFPSAIAISMSGNNKLKLEENSMKRKLVLKKQTIENLNRGTMVHLKGGAPGCHYPTLQQYECHTRPISALTCGRETCMCNSIWPTV